jgi:hypothetical protein
MQLNDIVIDVLGGREHDRPDGCASAPFEIATAIAWRLSECVQSRGPRRVGAVPHFEVRKLEPRWLRMRSLEGLERFRAEHLKEQEISSRSASLSSPIHFCAAAIRSRSTSISLIRSAFRLRVDSSSSSVVSRCSLSSPAFLISSTCASISERRMPVRTVLCSRSSSTSARLPSSRRIVSVFRTSA